MSIIIYNIGDTPRKGKQKAKGDVHHITSRIIGVEVHCGPIHGTFLYYTDNMTQGGANIIIEITRQGKCIIYVDF